MVLFESYAGMYQYRELPRFASFLLTQKLEDIAQHQIELSRQHAVPILKFLQHLSPDQLIALTKESMIELLSHLQDNAGAGYIRMSLHRWLGDQLAIVGKMEVVAEDITLISYIRNKSFKKWVPAYTTDIQKMLELNDEIDLFFMGQDTSGINTYINILKENITKKENQLLEAQSIAHLGSFEWDIEKDISISTPELRKIFGLKDRQPYEVFLKSVHPEDAVKLKEAMAAALVSGNFECEYRYHSPAGEKTLWTIGIVTYKDDKPVLMQGTVQDITERKNIERELMHKTAQLERSNESLQQFASVASHDLKEPLRKISTFTDVVLNTEENISQKSATNLQKVKDAARRMQQMISDILSYSSIEGTGKEQTNLQVLLDETLEVLDQAIKEKNAVVTTDGLPHACVDAAQVRQLFQNLIANALKFSKPDVAPHIHITHEIKPGKDLSLPAINSNTDYLQISIADNGIGFEEEYAEKIFGLFNRLHSKSAYEGTGLGLSIARRIVENHQGFIAATSKKNAGATFIITLPLHNTA